jgi:signal transduction histidine kinase
MNLNKLLLVTDDESIILPSAQRQMIQPHQIIRVESDNEALALLERTNIDVVVVDCSGKKRYADRVLRKIKDIQILPLIILVVNADGVAKIDSPWGMAADDFLIKPLDWQELYYRITKCLRRKMTGPVSRRGANRAGVGEDGGDRFTSEQMDSLSVLAGGIAHQFNNALSAITGNTELIEMLFADYANLAKYIEPIKDSAKRMANLTSQLSAYAGEGKYYFKNISLSEFVKDTLDIIDYTLNPDIDLVTRFEADTAIIEADPAQLQLVLSSIIANSNEAIQEKGQIIITVKNKTIPPLTFETSTDLKPGLYVHFNIKDNGNGMSAETLNRIFEPFFTTKFQGRGMGMAAVYKIIESHRGAIQVASELGIGTEVDIYLPAIPGKKKKDIAEKAKVVSGSGTILAIEDDLSILRVYQIILEKSGYQVLAAETGLEAIRLSKHFGGPIDLVILDIVLPDMKAEQIYQRIKTFRPDVKVIICTGLSDRNRAQEMLDAGAEGYLRKPFSFATLSAKVNEVMS